MATAPTIKIRVIIDNKGLKTIQRAADNFVLIKGLLKDNLKAKCLDKKDENVKKLIGLFNSTASLFCDTAQGFFKVVKAPK